MKVHHFFTILSAAASIAHASNWFVATNGTYSGLTAGSGSITNPWALQCALTNDTVIQAGDTIWLRAGNYSPVITNGINSIHAVDTNCNQVGNGEVEWMTGLNGPAFGDSNLLVTIRSFSNEWAKIDGVWRDNWQPTDSNGNIQWGYLQFRDLEFFDSMKGHHATNLCSYPEGPWVHFAPKFTKVQDFVNCAVHDVDNCFGPTARSIRGCIIWNVGVNGYEHVCYPSPSSNFSGNIVGWTVNDVIEHSQSGFHMQSNIIFGSGQTSTNTGGIDAKLDGSNVVYVGNCTYNYFPTPPGGNPYNLPNGVGFEGLGYANVFGNVFVAPQPLALGNYGYTNFWFSNNVVVMNETPWPPAYLYSPVMCGTNGYAINSNSYFAYPDAEYAPNPGFDYVNQNGSYFLSWSQWRATNSAWDSLSTATNAMPTNTWVFAMQNQDAPKRCNIAIYNFASNNTVAVNLSGVLNPGDGYQLYNAQNYNGGVIQSGFYNGTNIVVPMTNLTTAPILYGTNWGLFQPPPMSPTFGAFVVIGSPAPTLTPQNGFQLKSFSP